MCVCVCVVPFSLHTYQVWFNLVYLFNGKSTMDVRGLQNNPSSRAEKHGRLE